MSTLNVANISDGTDTVETGYVVNGSAKVWVNFNGTGTVAVRDSFNVSGLVDNGTGDYTVNFTNAFGDADCAVSLNGRVVSGSVGILVGNANNFGSNSASAARFSTAVDNTAALDADFVYSAVHGDLA